MNEHVALAAVGANVGLAGLNGAIQKFLANMSPILSFTLLLLQVTVAALTAWFLFKKVREVDRKQKYYEQQLAKKKRVARRKKPAKKRAARSVKKIAAVLAVLATIFLFTGCMGVAHVPGGRVSTPLADQWQSKSPKDQTSLATEMERKEEFVLPAGSIVISEGSRFVLQTNMPVSITVREKVDSNLGAADMSIGKIIAKLQSLRWIQGVGIVVFLFGIASMVYPPLRLLIASTTTSLVIGAAGLGLIVLPILLVGQEILILVGCLGLAGLYLFLHRYGKKSGENKILKRWVDANGNGKVDPGEIVGGE
jgi:hypothetical protein